MDKFIFTICVLSVSSLIMVSSESVVLTEDSWHKMLEGEWMVKFYAPWCPACRSLEPVWASFAKKTTELGLTGVAKVDVQDNAGLSGRFLVTALPTIFHVKNGVFRIYRDGRDVSSFVNFITDKGYSSIEPVPSWKNPDSIQMSIVSSFFKLSMVLRNIQTVIVEEYKYPYWVSYALFAVATIIVGAILGLILVGLIECAYAVGGQTNQDEKTSVSYGKSKKAEDAKLTSTDSKKHDAKVEEISESDAGTGDSTTNTPRLRKRRPKKAD